MQLHFPALLGLYASSMGLLKKLFGNKQSQRQHDQASIPSRTAPGQSASAGRSQALDRPVQWPVDPNTGQVFDDEWLFDGLKRAVNENQFRAKSEMLNDMAVRRRERLSVPGLDGHNQADSMLRGRDWLEWGEFVHQMKREGHLQPALALVYEMMQTSTKSDVFDTVPPGWYREAAIIHRKLKDYDGEISLMKEALVSYPHDEDFEKRCAKARELKGKARN